MDAAALLRQAYDRAGLTMAEFAARGGTSRQAVRAYLRGEKSPTVRTLNRILAGVDLQVRATLEPWLADVDTRLDELLARTPTVDLGHIERLATSLEQATGDVRWALDGATALNLHGLAVEHPFPCLVLQFDQDARTWLTRGLMRSSVPECQDVGWHTMTLENAQRALAGIVVGRHGMLTMRPVAVLPPVLELRPAGAARCYPVVSVDEVERTHPDHAEVLGRLRARRAARGGS